MVGRDRDRRVARVYETPLPQDWVGFATQMHHQASGGPSYLWGETRMKGWWYYYLVALAVKVPLCFWLLAAARLTLVRGGDGECESRPHSNLLPLVFLLYLTITVAGSSRNYGCVTFFRWRRWQSSGSRRWPRAAHVLAASRRRCRSRRLRGRRGGNPSARAELFQRPRRGADGGRRILSDSNLDWGQGLKSLYRLQRERPEFQDLTLYYFGDTDPAHYGVTGGCHVINAVDDHSRIPGLATSKRRMSPSRHRFSGAPGARPAYSASRPRRADPADRRHDDRDLSNSRSVCLLGPRRADEQAALSP